MKLRIISIVLLAALAASAQDTKPTPAAPPDKDWVGWCCAVDQDQQGTTGKRKGGWDDDDPANASGPYSKRGKTAPQGSSIPGLGGIGFMDSPGYFEFGGSRSDLTTPIQPWTDIYFRGMLQPFERDSINLDIERQSRYGDAGWLYTLGVTHVFNDSVYASVDGSASRGGFFMPKYRADGFFNFKVLPLKQLVISAGGGMDLGKPVNGFSTRASRIEAGTTYYFSNWPFIVQSGFTLTRATPGNILAPSGYMAITEGHNKEHYITVRAEIGREGYQLFADQQHSQFAAFNFPIHNYTGTWRQWVGNNWGVNFSFERYVNPYFNRNGATIGLFLDF